MNLVISYANNYDFRPALCKLLRELASVIPFFQNIHSTIGQHLKINTLWRPIARMLIESPMSEEMEEVLRKGELKHEGRTWRVRRGTSNRMLNSRVWTLHGKCPSEQLNELWQDALEYLQEEYCEEDNRSRHDVLIRTGSWDGELATSRWVQVECKDRKAIPKMKEAIKELIQFLPIGDGNFYHEQKQQTAWRPSKCARLTIAGLAPTTTEIDIKKICSQYGRLEKVMVHYPENAPVTATVVMADHIEAVNMRLDLDGYDASQTIGNLRVFPQVDYYNLPNLPCSECDTRHNEENCPEKKLCTLCCQKTHHIDECFNPYPTSKVISDNRPDGGVIGPANRCGHCLQRGCSIPCRWSHQWATNHGILVQYRWTDKPEEATDTRAEEHDASRAERAINGPQSYAGVVRTTPLTQVGAGMCVGGDQIKDATKSIAPINSSASAHGVGVSSPTSEKKRGKGQRVGVNRTAQPEVNNDLTTTSGECSQACL